MVSAGGPQWRGAQAQWLYKCGVRLLLMILITPSDVSPGVHPHRDLFSCHKSRLDKMVSAGGPHSSLLSGTVLMISGAVLMISGSLSALTQSLL